MDRENVQKQKFVETTYTSQTQKKQLSFPIQQGNSPISAQYAQTYMQPVTYYQQPYTQITTQTIPVIEKIIREKDTGLVKQFQLKNLKQEEKVALLTTEIQRLQSALQSKNNELQEMTNKYHQLYQTIEQKQTSDNSIQVILNENKKIREEIETWKKSYMQFEENYQHLDKLRKEEERQKFTYSAENEKLKLEINQLKDKLYQSENSISQLTFQYNQETITKISELEHTLLIKTQQIEEYSKKVSSYEIQLKDQSKQQTMYNRFVLVAAENERIHKILRQVLSENDNERQNSQLLIQKIEYYEQQLNDSKQSQNQVMLLSTEIQRLKTQLDERNQIIEQSQSEYNTSIYMKEQMITELKNSQYQLDYTNNQKYQELENKVVQLTTEIERLQELRIQADQQSRKDEQKWKFQISEKDDMIYQLQEKISQLATELERIRGLLDEKTNEIQHSQSYMQSYTLKIQEITVSHSQLEKSNNEMLNQLKLYQQKNQSLLVTIADYEEKIAKLSTELERQQGLRYSLEMSQKENLEKSNSEMKKLQDKVLAYEQKCTHLSNEIMRLQQQNSTFSNDNSQLQANMQSLSQEVLKLEGMLKQSSNELEKFKKYTAQQQEALLELEDEKKKMKQLSEHNNSKLSMQEETITKITITITEREQQISLLQEQLTLILNEFKTLEAEHKATNNYLSKYQSKQMSFDLSIEKNRKLLINYVLICTEVEALRYRIQQLLDDNAQARMSIVKQAEIVKQSQFLPRTSTQVYETVRMSKQSQF